MAGCTHQEEEQILFDWKIVSFTLKLLSAQDIKKTKKIQVTFWLIS